MDPNTLQEIVPRTDFFGGKHDYKRDADGLYSPPDYLYDEMESEYETFLLNGPPKVLEDKKVGKDGTIKHFVAASLDANGQPTTSVRVCDWIEDRHGNRTTLHYGRTVPVANGGQRKLLTQVTDPSGRSLFFTWGQMNGTTTSWRITSVQGPLYRVDYTYHTNSSEAASYLNLASVTLDAGEGGLRRTTRYTYTHHSGSQGRADGLLASITDPLGHRISYHYMDTEPYSGGATPLHTNTVWVQDITEHGVHDPWMNAPLRWKFIVSALTVTVHQDNYLPGSPDLNPMTVRVFCISDPALRCTRLTGGNNHYIHYYKKYDLYNNVTETDDF